MNPATTTVDIGPMTLEEAPSLAGHVRIVMLDESGTGCSVYVQSGEIAGMLEMLAGEPLDERPLADCATDPDFLAHARAAAFDCVRSNNPEAHVGGAMLGLHCAVTGPQGDLVRRQLSVELAESGRAAIVMMRNGATGACITAVTTVATPAYIDRLGMMLGEAGRMPVGRFVARGSVADRRRSH